MGPNPARTVIDEPPKKVSLALRRARVWREKGGNCIPLYVGDVNQVRPRHLEEERKYKRINATHIFLSTTLNLEGERVVSGVLKLSSSILLGRGFFM
jgi:hypothetical protein